MESDRHLAQFLAGRPSVGVERDIGHRRFAAIGIGPSDHERFLHPRMVEQDVFARFVSPPGGTAHDLADIDLQLKPDSRPVDAGVPLVYFSGEVTGAGPDLGAYEVGAPTPHYGPR